MVDRSAQIRENLRLLYEQLGGQEKAKILAPFEERIRIEQCIKSIRTDIWRFEAELQEVKIPKNFSIDWVSNWVGSDQNLFPLLVQNLTERNIESFGEALKTGNFEHESLSGLKDYLEKPVDLIPDKDRFWVLVCYLRFLQGDLNVGTTILQEQEKLELKLIKQNSDGTIEIDNPIYKSFFSEEYLTTKLEILRPYAQDFLSWVRNPSSKTKELTPEILESLNNPSYYKNTHDKEHDFLIFKLFEQAVCTYGKLNFMKDLKPFLQNFRKQIEKICDRPYALIRLILEWKPKEEPIIEEVCDLVLQDIKINEYKYTDPSEEERYIGALLRFAESTESIAEKIRVYDRILEVDPYHPEALLQREVATKKLEPETQDTCEDISMQTSDVAQSSVESLDQLLDKVVDNSNRDLTAILVFDLIEGLPLYGNPGLELTDPGMYDALFGDGTGDVIEELNTLSTIQDALNKFGKKIKSGDLKDSIFRLTEGTMIVYFGNFQNLPVAICFIFPEKVNLGRVIVQVRKNIDSIYEALKKALNI